MNKSTGHTQGGATNADIFQCPKCLDVQENSEVCLTCGLIFKKYFVAERLNNSGTSMVSIDNESQQDDPLDPRLQKLKDIISKGIVLYFIVAILIAIFDIGDLEISKSYCNVVKALVPSLYGTSIISEEPNNTCLILALSWTMSFVTICLVIKWLIKQPIKESARLIPDSNFLIRLLGLVLSTALVADTYFVALSKPEHGMISKATYFLVSKWAVTSALWGLVIYSGNFFMLIILVTFVVKLVDRTTSNNWCN